MHGEHEPDNAAAAAGAFVNRQVRNRAVILNISAADRRLFGKVKVLHDRAGRLNRRRVHRRKGARLFVLRFGDVDKVREHFVADRGRTLRPPIAFVVD